MKVHEFSSEIWLPLPPEEIFPFFADAANLDAITPPWLSFRIATPPPITMREGALIDYRLKVRGIPLGWRTRINVWEPPHRFEDEQLRGPYRQWIHEHTFEASNGGTLARDIVRYAVPLDFLLHKLMVKRDIAQIFQYRTDSLRKLFHPDYRPTDD
jgi:ligand-binding SRPBCC domain-containing protein